MGEYISTGSLAAVISQIVVIPSLVIELRNTRYSKVVSIDEKETACCLFAPYEPGPCFSVS
jgi:hypothetical protein